MAAKKSKKPSIANAPKRKYTRRAAAPEVTEKTLGESIIEQMIVANAALATIAKAMQERNGMLAVVTTATEQQTAAVKEILTPAKVDAIAAKVAEVTPATAAEIDTALAPLKKKRGRPSKADLAARAAADLDAKRAENGLPAMADMVPGSTKLEKAEEGEPAEAFTRSTFPAMCPCGVREDLPPHLHAKACPVHGKPGEPVPAVRPVIEEVKAPAVPANTAVTVPTVDEIRGVAIAYIGRHGRDALTTLLAKYKADKLTSVTETERAALMAELQAGVA